jgi:hypothetical protein
VLLHDVGQQRRRGLGHRQDHLRAAGEVLAERGDVLGGLEVGVGVASRRLHRLLRRVEVEPTHEDRRDDTFGGFALHPTAGHQLLHGQDRQPPRLHAEVLHVDLPGERLAQRVLLRLAGPAGPALTAQRHRLRQAGVVAVDARQRHPLENVDLDELSGHVGLLSSQRCGLVGPD